jgi:hypothetical protein
MNPFATLSDENQDQIRKYLRFFRQKKDGILRSIQREINDIKSDRVNEDVFTREDLLDILEFLSSAVKVDDIHIILFILVISSYFIRVKSLVT